MILENSLKFALDQRKKEFTKTADDKKKQIYAEGIQAISDDGIIGTAKQVGDIAPDFILKNALNREVKLSEYLKKGNVILTWYRGGWCPYCNITLQHLQRNLPDFKAKNAYLIALTPEFPDKSLTTSEKNQLEFEVLSDVDNKVAKDYGVVFKVTQEVSKIYQESFDVHSYNGNKSDELPLAATYVINQEGKIIYAFLGEDYRNRAEPSDILNIL